MSGVINSDPLLPCPYNPSHMILKSRMQYHLVKCAKSFPDVERDTCPYNATHRIPRPEMRFHLEKCPDQRILEEQKYQAKDEVIYGGVTEYVKPSLPTNDENWDEEDCPSYEPSSSVSERVLLRNLSGATKSQRKQFRCEQRKRVANLNNGIPVEDPSPLSSNAQLRLPREPSQAVQSLAPGSRLGLGRSKQILCPETDSTVGAGSIPPGSRLGMGRANLCNYMDTETTVGADSDAKINSFARGRRGR